MNDRNEITEGTVETSPEYSPEDEAEVLGTENDGDVDPNEQDSFDFDEDGDIIIPDEPNDAPEEQYDSEDGEEPAEEADTTENGKPNEEGEAPEARKPTDTENELRESLASITQYAKAALKTIGVEGDDVLDNLIKVAAEGEGVSKEELVARLDGAKALVKQREAQYTALAENDLRELKSLFPACSQYSSLAEIPNAVKYAAYRDKGLSVKEAFAAVNTDLLAESATRAARKNAVSDKAHLKSAVPRKSGGEEKRISRRDVEQMRDIYPDMPDKEIVALLKRVN
ncbi:MAG: hypothetical protein IKA64_01875 [Clostridia bacterium]|nr:hypothetical protein [Clostridia bacterium]